MTVALLLAAALLLLGAGTALRQRRTVRDLAARALVPGDERAYLRKQAARRLLVAGLFALIGAMIGGSFLSGMEARAEGDAVDRAFARFYGAYWIAVLLLVLAVACLATFDLWATRRYWHRLYRQLRDDHNALLQRDLAVHRQQKMQDREARLRRGLK